MVQHKCITCEKYFRVPFDEKTYKIWLEINQIEGKGANTAFRYECPECIGMDVLKCDYIEVTMILGKKEIIDE